MAIPNYYPPFKMQDYDGSLASTIPPGRPYDQPFSFEDVPDAVPTIDRDAYQLSTPAQDALIDYANQQPQYENPGILNRITAGMAGASEGWFRGAGAGVDTAQRVLMTPYRQAIERWKLGLGPREVAAQAEARQGGWGLRAAQLQLGRDRLNAQNDRFQKGLDWKKIALDSKKGSTAYTGSWGSAPVQYIDPSGGIHQISQNTKTGEMFEHVNGEKIPIKGLGQGWEKNTSQVRDFTTPDESIGVFDPAKLLRGAGSEGEPKKTTPTVKKTNIKKAPPIPGILLGDTGGAKAFYGRGGVTTPVPPEVEGLRKTPKSEAQLTKEDAIQGVSLDLDRLADLYPKVKDKLGTLSSAVHDFVPEKWLLAAQKLGAPVDPDLLAFIETSRSLTAEEVKRRSGVAFKDWEMNWVLSSLPTYGTVNFERNMRRAKLGLQIMMKNRNMSKMEFDKEISAATGQQEQAIPKRWKRYPGGQTIIEDSPGKWREVDKGDVLDEKYGIK